MASKTLNTRIQLKTDTEANWDAKDFVPKIGEVIIYSADENHRFSRMKIGDGTTQVKDLPFMDASTLGGVSLDNIVAKRVAHKLTFGRGGAFVYDGSADVTVPVYTGDVNVN